LIGTLPFAAFPVNCRSVEGPVPEGGGAGAAVVWLAELLTIGVRAASVPLTVAELVIVWFCICAITLIDGSAWGGST